MATWCGLSSFRDTRPFHILNADTYKTHLIHISDKPAELLTINNDTAVVDLIQPIPNEIKQPIPIAPGYVYDAFTKQIINMYVGYDDVVHATTRATHHGPTPGEEDGFLHQHFVYMKKTSSFYLFTPLVTGRGRHYRIDKYKFSNYDWTNIGEANIEIGPPTQESFYCGPLTENTIALMSVELSRVGYKLLIYPFDIQSEMWLPAMSIPFDTVGNIFLSRYTCGEWCWGNTTLFTMGRPNTYHVVGRLPGDGGTFSVYIRALPSESYVTSLIRTDKSNLVAFGQYRKPSEKYLGWVGKVAPNLTWEFKLVTYLKNLKTIRKRPETLFAFLIKGAGIVEAANPSICQSIALTGEALKIVKEAAPAIGIKTLFSLRHTREGVIASIASKNDCFTDKIDLETWNSVFVHKQPIQQFYNKYPILGLLHGAKIVETPK